MNGQTLCRGISDGFFLLVTDEEFKADSEDYAMISQNYIRIYEQHLTVMHVSRHQDAKICDQIQLCLPYSLENKHKEQKTKKERKSQFNRPQLRVHGILEVPSAKSQNNKGSSKDK